MMKFLLHIWFVMMLLTGILVSCDRVPKYDSRLIEVDSLLHHKSQRKIALQKLENIDFKGLTNEEDRAFYGLLITQALYTNYIKLSDDKEINTAIDYYKNHNKEKDKLTRAYLYKGAVLQDLGKPDTAMIYYKMADVTATEENDYFNLGYARLRMGKLYYKYHAYDGREIEKLEQALNYFRLAEDTSYQIVCLKDLGAFYRSSNPEKADNRYHEAISLSQIKEDTSNLINSLSGLAYLYFMNGQKDKKYFNQAYRQLQQIKKYGLKDLSDNVYTTFACVYANLNMPDSASQYLQLAPKSKAKDSTYLNSNNYIEALSQIAKAQGNIVEYYRLSHVSDSITLSSVYDYNIVNIMNAELNFNNQHQIDLKNERKRNSAILAAVAGALLLSLLILALLFYRRAHRYDKLVLELKDRSQSQINDLANLQDNINELKINDERLKGFISSHMGMMREMIEACYHEPNNRIAENMKHIVKYQDSNRDNWARLYDYIDLEHNNIMARTRENYPQLNDRELLLLALTCMGFSYIQTAIIMGYSNATSVSVIKQRLAKKMGLEGSLNDYIDSFTDEKTTSET